MCLRFLVVLIAFALVACDSSKPARPSNVTPTATIDARPWVIDLDSFERVYDVAGTGRVPLGLSNTVYIDRANARFDGFYAGDDLPSDIYLSLSIITSAPRSELIAIDGRSYVAYEWWFAISDDIDATSVPDDSAPALRLSLRESTGGDWTIYAHTGTGWTPVPRATYAIGEYEVSARVPLNPAWGMDRNRTRTFLRALTRSEYAIVRESRTFGYVYPDDLSWREVLHYE